MNEQRMHFDQVARLYESVRPGYSPLLIDDLLWLSGIQPNTHILDIGCGTGKSTEPFAMRGFQICALDPGENMLNVCREKLGRYPNVSYENTAFETWSTKGQVFDLVIAGTAFHWIREAGYTQLMHVLKPQGAVGIFWHTFLRGKGPISDQLDHIYQKHASELVVDDPQSIQELHERRKEEQFLSWAGFSEKRIIRYYDQVRYTASGYLDLLRTWPNHRNLSESFFEAVATLINDAGGDIVKPIRTTLCYGRRITS